MAKQNNTYLHLLFIYLFIFAHLPHLQKVEGGVYNGVPIGRIQFKKELEDALFEKVHIAVASTNYCSLRGRARDAEMLHKTEAKLLRHLKLLKFIHLDPRCANMLGFVSLQAAVGRFDALTAL